MRGVRSDSGSGRETGFEGAVKPVWHYLTAAASGGAPVIQTMPKAKERRADFGTDPSSRTASKQLRAACFV